MSGEETNQAGQTPVDSHAEGERPGEVRPKTPPPTDIQQRETIAAKVYAAMRWASPISTPDYIPFGTSAAQEEARKIADEILALRSNPQPGSEGEPVAWRVFWRDPKRGGTERESHFTLNKADAIRCEIEGYVVQALYAASPTPPTAQPGEVERLRSALERIEQQEHPGPVPSFPGSHPGADAAWKDFYRETVIHYRQIARAALTPSESHDQ